MSDALIIFVRNPQLGKVKTRLAATLGEEKALAIYQQLLAHTLVITKNCVAEKYVFYAGALAEKDQWEQEGYKQLLQQEGDLGEKMHHAFETVFSAGHQKVVIIGSDCIELTEALIAEAFHGLDKNDAVIGPANDGGYYLLGLKQIYAPLFLNKPWSTDAVYAATIKDFEAVQLSFSVLPVLIDIDTEEDWNAAQKNSSHCSPFLSASVKILF